MRENVSLLAFNRGLVSSLGLARADIKRMAMAAETYTNWMPRVLGSMMLRPGLRYIGSTLTNLTARFLPFIFSATDKAKIELTANVMRVWLGDTVITRPSVSSAVTNGTFTEYTTTFTVTSANPGLFTYVGADNFAESDPVTFTTTGALPTNLVVGTTYYIKVGTLNVGANSFQVALTPTGTAIDCSAGVQSGVHTLHDYYFVTGWTDADESGSVSQWNSSGLSFLGTGINAAIRYQAVTVAAGDQGDEHAIHIVVGRGPVTLRVGTAAGLDDYITETSLDTGVHSLALTPTGDFYIQLQSRLPRLILVTSVAIEASGTMQVLTPWAEADLPNIKYDQSGDIIFCACSDIQQYKIERRDTRSWSVVKYLAEDGPFNVMNTSLITITPSVFTGNGTLTASKPYFKTTDVGALFACTSTGQDVRKLLTAVNEATDSILVEGVGTNRTFLVVASPISGTGNTIALQQSFDNATWVTVLNYTVTITGAHYTDGLDNQPVYYRLMMSVDGGATDTDCRLDIPTGFKRGVCRLTGYTSTTVMSMEVLKIFGGIEAIDDWEPGIWSDRHGWPTAVSFYEGRLWWFGKDRVIGSLSDAYYSFDPETDGNGGVINRQIGSGPVDTINWGLPLQRLILGGQYTEFSCRSTSFDEPLTPTNFNIKKPSTQGSSNAQAIVIDEKGIFVQRGGNRLFELTLDGGILDYIANNLAALVPEIGAPGIIRVVAQRQPDTRIHCLRSDGTVAILIYDKVENVLCWIEAETDGVVEDILVLPGDNGDLEDQVFYLVRRTINSATVRYLEQWATEAECQGGTLNKQADSFVVYSGAALATITGLDHLEGEEVVVWADGADVGHDTSDARIYTVSGGQITLATAASNVIVGLPYTAQWKSGKLVQLANGNALKASKQIKGLGVILKNTHYKGLKFGQDFTHLDDLPSMEFGAPVAAGTIHADYDEQSFGFPGEWTTDSRLCLQAMAPRPCNILAAVCDTEYH